MAQSQSSTQEGSACPALLPFPSEFAKGVVLVFKQHNSLSGESGILIQSKMLHKKAWIPEDKMPVVSTSFQTLLIYSCIGGCFQGLCASECQIGYLTVNVPCSTGGYVIFSLGSPARASESSP